LIQRRRTKSQQNPMPLKGNLIQKRSKNMQNPMTLTGNGSILIQTRRSKRP